VRSFQTAFSAGEISLSAERARRDTRTRRRAKRRGLMARREKAGRKSSRDSGRGAISAGKNGSTESYFAFAFAGPGIDSRPERPSAFIARARAVCHPAIARCRDCIEGCPFESARIHPSELFLSLRKTLDDNACAICRKRADHVTYTRVHYTYFSAKVSLPPHLLSLFLLKSSHMHAFIGSIIFLIGFESK